MHTPSLIRNLAIIAHIDHGKTTLMDSLLRFTNVFRENEEIPSRAMDQFALEKERGITIFSKHTSLFFREYKINLIDTPGHADFSGEVERVLGMVNAVLLLVDAKEGPMPQTKFVLSQALKLHLKPIVILNKVDRPHANPEKALDKTFDLFVELGATDQQLDFPFCFCSGLLGYAKRSLKDASVNMLPLFEMIISQVPPPEGSLEDPFLMQVATLSHSDYTGRSATGRILSGKVCQGDVLTASRKTTEALQILKKVTLIEGYLGLKKIVLAEAGAGDIVNISGFPEIKIGDTLCDPKHVQTLPPIALGEPTLSVNILVNTSPFSGREGKYVTLNKIYDRLIREKRSNVSLQIEKPKDREDLVTLSGRGELHLSIVIETMRREGFEFSISKPQVLTKKKQGTLYEPFETVSIEIQELYSGTVIEELSKRKGILESLQTKRQNIVTMQFTIPTRGLLGFKNEFLTLSKGNGLISSHFKEYAPFKENIPKRKLGSLVSNNLGKATPYALFSLKDRGTFFISPGTAVYKGMILGEHTRSNDLIVNITKEKHLTNIRSSGSDEHILLDPPRILTVETAMDFIKDDECIEITPQSIRLYKAQDS